MMKIYAGKLSKDITEDDLRNAFEKYGYVTSVYIMRFNENGEDFLYATIEMPVKNQAIAAMDALNGSEVKGITLNIHPARVGPKDRRKPGRPGGRRKGDPSEN